jgi:hypothetical protein
VLFCVNRILWKSKKDELKNSEDNTDVTSHLAFAIVATIITVKEEVIVLLATELFKIYVASNF